MVTFGYVIPSFGPFAEPHSFGHLLDVGEEAGFHDVWFGDHVVVPSYAAALTHPDWLDPLTACAFGLARTRRLGFGTDVLVAPYRHPALVAKMVASADHLGGGGRMTLGVGVGYLRGEFAVLGADYPGRGAVTDEFLDAVRLLWSSTAPTEFTGTHIAFRDAVFGPRPTAPIPLWVGGNNPRALRRAALRGDGWHPLFPTPEEYAASRRRILALREGTGQTRPFTFSYSCALTRLDDAPGRRAATGTWSEQGAVPDDYSYAPPLPLAADGRPRFSGTPDQVASDISTYIEAGVEHFTLRFATGSPDDSVEGLASQLVRFASDIAPRFAG